MGGKSEKYEVLDLTSYHGKKTWTDKIFGDISKQSALQQVAIGGATGWVAGFMLVKVGKVAAASVGTTLLILQIAQNQGYIKVDWRKMEKEFETAKKELTREANKHYPGFFENVKTFVQQNMFAAGGFAGGFFLGMAC